MNAVRELKFLKCLQHKNIVQLRDVVTSRGYEEAEKRVKTDSNRTVEEKKIDNEEAKNGGAGDILNLCGNLYLVFEFVEHDLGGLLDSKYRFNVREVKCIAKQLFEVLEFLAEKKVLHRDIKSSNILLTNRHQVKLADFGLARSIQSADGRDLRVDLTNNVVTMWYKAPELLLGAVRYSHSVDVWSTGCVIAELELGRPLFPGRTEIEQIDLICRTLGNPSDEIWSGLSRMPNYESLLQPLNTYSTTLKNSLSGKLSDGVVELLDRVLVFDPLRRPSAKILLNHKYFLTQPLAPIDPADLEPLQVGAGVSCHEFRSKQQKRQRDVNSDSSASVKAKFSTEGTSSNTSLPGFGGANSASSNEGISANVAMSNVSISTIMANLSATITANSLTATGIASASAMYSYSTAGTAPPPPSLPPPLPAPVPYSSLPNITTLPPTPMQPSGAVPGWAPPPPRGPVMSSVGGPMNSSVGPGGVMINPRPPPPAAPINPPYGAGVNANPVPYGASIRVAGSGNVSANEAYGAPIVPVAAPSMYNTYGAVVNTSIPSGASGVESAYSTQSAYKAPYPGDNNSSVYGQDRSYGGRGRGDNVYTNNGSGRGDYGGRGGRGGRGYYPPTDPYSSSGSGGSIYGAPVAPASVVGTYGAAVNTSTGSSGGMYGSGNPPYSGGAGYGAEVNTSGSYNATGQSNSVYGGYGASVNPAPRSNYEGASSGGGTYGTVNSGSMYGNSANASSHYGPGASAPPSYPPSGGNNANSANYNTNLPYGNAPPRGPPGPGRGYNAYNNSNNNYGGGRGQQGNYQNRF